MIEEELREKETTVEALLTKESKAFRKFFLKFIRSLKTQESYENILTYLRMGRPDLVVLYVNNQMSDFLPEILAAFLAGANFETRQLLGLSKQFSIPYTFDMSNSLSVSQLSDLQNTFIREMSRSNSRLINSVISDFQSTASNEVIAKEIIDNYGLTSKSYEASKNYRSSLEKLSSFSLDRQLKNDNYDELIISAIAADQLLPKTQIDKIVASYKKNLIESRATQVANTSGKSFVETGRFVAANLFNTALGVFGYETVEQWRSKKDDKVRFTHTHASLDGQIIPQGGVFRSISGATLRYPRDPSAPIRETINCRCNVIRYIRRKP